MALEIVARASRAGRAVNENAAGATRRGMVDTAWVLDGATGLAGREQVPDGPTDAAWLVGALVPDQAALPPYALPSAAAISVESFAARPGTRVLLCSDGYWRLVDHFRRYDAAGLLAASFEQDSDALFDQLRGLEAADADCRATARIKTMDDATALLLRR